MGNKYPQLAFYADTPRRERNRAFYWKVQDLDHAMDLAVKFYREYGFKFRKIYFNPNPTTSISIMHHIDFQNHTRRIDLYRDEAEERKWIVFNRQYKGSLPCTPNPNCGGS